MKVDDFNLSKLSNEAENFKEEVQNILNFGKYSADVVTNTPPSWTARNGEFVFFVSGTLKRIYFYNNNAWDYVEYNAGATANSIRGWINFQGTGGVVNINDSFNVTSLTRNAAGDFTITWDTDFANSSYAIAGTARRDLNETDPRVVVIDSSGMAVGTTRILTMHQASGPVDRDQVHVMAIGDQ